MLRYLAIVAAAAGTALAQPMPTNPCPNCEAPLPWWFPENPTPAEVLCGQNWQSWYTTEVVRQCGYDPWAPCGAAMDACCAAIRAQRDNAIWVCFQQHDRGPFTIHELSALIVEKCPGFWFLVCPAPMSPGAYDREITALTAALAVLQGGGTCESAFWVYVAARGWGC